MIELTRPGKDTLVVENPVMPAAGTFGFDGAGYRDMIDLTKLGAIVTNPVTYKARQIARGPRVVPLPSGTLIHTGLPNPGVRKIIQRYGTAWERSLAPVIVHVVATTPNDVARCAGALDAVAGIAGIELGLHDRATPDDVVEMVGAALDNTLRPLLVRVPLYSALESARAAEDAGAGGLVIAAPPRGTTRNPQSGRLSGGRIYGPWLKAQTLRALGLVAQVVEIPVIGSGGIHSPDDARDFIEAGAVAVQVDSVTWVEPRTLEIIARNLGGLELTRAAGALADEWQPGIGETARHKESSDDHAEDAFADPDDPAAPPRPPHLPA